MKKLVVTSIFCFLLWSLHAQVSLTGRVVNENQERLEFAVIYIEGTQWSASTDRNGLYVIPEVVPGTYVVSCSYLGYETSKKTVAIDKSLSLDFVLGGGLYHLEEVEIKSNKNKFVLTPGSEEVGKDMLNRENLGQDVPVLLQMQTSVVATSDAGAGIGYTGLRIRGTDQARINVTINDIPINDAESQNVFWVDLPDIAASTEKIRIQRGVGPSTNGAGAYGGTLALNTFGNAINPYIHLNTSIGSFGTKKFSAILNSGLINNQYSIEARYSSIHSDGYIDRASANLSSWYIEGAKVNSSSSLRLIAFSGKEVTYQSWNGSPEALLSGDVNRLRDHFVRNQGSIYQTADDSLNLFNAGRTYNYYTYENQVDDYTQTHLQAHYAKVFSSKFRTKLALHYTLGKGFFEQFRNDESLTSDYGLPAFSIDSNTYDQGNLVRRRWLDNDFYGVVGKMEYAFNDRHVLSLGGGINRYDGLHFGEVIRFEVLDSLRRYYGRYYDNTGNKKDGNIYLRWEKSWGKKWSAAADLQYRNVQYQVSGLDNDLRNLSVDANFHFFNPKFTVNYALSDHRNLLFSFAVANREPDRSDFIDNPINAVPSHETLYDTEVSMTWQKPRWRMETNVYWMNYKNQLLATGALNDVGNTIRINVPDSYRLGLEWSGSYALHQKWNAGFNLTLSRNKVKSFNEVIYNYGSEGPPIINVAHSNTDIALSPNVVGGLFLTFSPISSLQFHLQNRLIGSQYLDNTTNKARQLPSYHFSNCRIQWNPEWKAAKKTQLVLQVNNVLNQLYSSNGYTYSYYSGLIITENFLYPQAGRHFMLGLELRL